MFPAFVFGAVCGLLLVFMFFTYKNMVDNLINTARIKSLEERMDILVIRLGGMPTWNDDTGINGMDNWSPTEQDVIEELKKSIKEENQ